MTVALVAVGAVADAAAAVVVVVAVAAAAANAPVITIAIERGHTLSFQIIYELFKLSGQFFFSSKFFN